MHGGVRGRGLITPSYSIGIKAAMQMIPIPRWNKKGCYADDSSTFAAIFSMVYYHKTGKISSLVNDSIMSYTAFLTGDRKTQSRNKAEQMGGKGRHDGRKHMA